MARKRLLLVNPTYGTSFWGLDHAMRLAGCAHSIAPLGLVTVAALTPPEWDVELADESVAPIDLDTPCDVVGIGAMNVQAARAFELADEFRRRGRTVVMGGPFATLQPDRCAPHADVLVIGDAERTWPQVCRDFERGELRRRYEQIEVLDLAESPVPRYDLLVPGAYAGIPIQTTRGCPFSCEFCDIIVMAGRRVRTKPVENVLREVAATRCAGSGSIFFTDDNFIGNQRFAKQLCEGLARYREETGHRPFLFTQASVNLAERPALLDAMVRAGFTRVFIGVESPRQASLGEAGKRQNVHGDLVERIHTIQRAGLVVWAGMIVGFDNDDARIFEEQATFLDRAGVAVAMVGMLNAPPRTPLYERLEKDGRIDPGSDWADNCAWTNIVPLRMSRPELYEGYASLVTVLYDQERYVRRLMANIRRMGQPPESNAGTRLPRVVDLQDLWRTASHFTFSRDPASRRHFVPNFVRVLLEHPERVVEAAMHLGLWSHFQVYVPELVEQLHAAARVERVAERERVYVAPSGRVAPVLAAEMGVSLAGLGALA